MLDFTIQLSRTNELLERIATALERAVPPHPDEALGFRKRGPESLHTYGDNESAWARENFYELIHGQGLSSQQEQAIVEEATKEFNQSQEEMDGLSLG